MRFAIYDVTSNEKKSAVRVEEDGSVLLFVKGPGGAVLHSAETNISPERAAALITGITENFEQLPPSPGPHSIGRGDGMGMPEMVTFIDQDVPSALVGPIRSLRELLSEVHEQTGGAEEDLHPVEREGPINKFEIALWGSALMVAHLVAGFVVVMTLLSGMALLVQRVDADPTMLVVGSIVGAVAVTFICIGLLYFIAGYLVGRITENDPKRTAFWVGVAALGIPAIATLLVGAVPSLAAMAVLPWIAGMGGKLAGRARDDLEELRY